MSSIFRPVYRQLDDFEKQKVEDIKSIAEDLLAAITRTREGGSHLADNDQAVEDRMRRLATMGRCQSLAVTKLEEAVMWAVKGVTAP